IAISILGMGTDHSTLPQTELRGIEVDKEIEASPVFEVFVPGAFHQSLVEMRGVEFDADAPLLKPCACAAPVPGQAIVDFRAGDACTHGHQEDRAKDARLDCGLGSHVDET